MKKTDTEFFSEEPGAIFRKTSANPEFRLCLLHGDASSAHTFRHDTRKLSKFMPEAEILTMNGFHKLSDNEMKETWKRHFVTRRQKEIAPGFFSWPTGGAEDSVDKIIGILETENHRMQLPTVIFGFSMGGLRAADVTVKRPDLVEGAVLHSSGLVELDLKTAFQNASKRPEEKKPEIHTIVSPFDPVVWMVIFAGQAGLHLKNEAALNRMGYLHKTHVVNVIDHETSEESLSKSASLIRRMLPETAKEQVKNTPEFYQDLCAG